MKCYFLRHGIAAEPDEWQGSDFDRPLTARGRERMAAAARALAALHIEPGTILTSPLVRAKQTAEIVAKELKLRDRLVEDVRLGPGFDPHRLAAILAERPDADAVMLVGHEPSMSATVGCLIGGARIDFKKGSLALVNVADPASLQGELAWFVTAKILAGTRR